MNHVGVIVKKLREKAGLSQNQLAKSAGVSQAALSKIESEEKNPSVETVFLLAAALDCTVSELLGEKPEGVTFLTDRQRQLLEIFQQLNDAGKNSLLALAESMLRQADFRQDGSISSAI